MRAHGSERGEGAKREVKTSAPMLVRPPAPVIFEDGKLDGPVRAWRFHNAPEHEWLRKG